MVPNYTTLPCHPFLIDLLLLSSRRQAHRELPVVCDATDNNVLSRLLDVHIETTKDLPISMLTQYEVFHMKTYLRQQLMQFHQCNIFT